MEETSQSADPVLDLVSPACDATDPSELRAHYVDRLRRLLRLRRHHLDELNQEGLWLLDRCIFATYRDCVEVGAGLAAREVLTAGLSRRMKEDGPTVSWRRRRSS